ncbi:MAG TPA: hypothetical protein VF230_14815 [Acidimicrobiales bacterium]
MPPKVTVTPSTFELVNFDAGAIEAIASEVAAAVDLPADAVVAINVDEAEMMGRSKTTVAGNEVTVDVSGGGFESLRKAREFAPERCRAVLGQALMRARDRLDPAFGDPPADDEVPVRLEAAWSSYIEGRLERKGVLPGRPQRRIYHFRVRHGFNDSVDAVFDRLWNADGLTWADIEAASREAAGEPVTA